MVVVRYAVVPWGTSPVTRAVVVVPLSGDAAKIREPFWLPVAVRMTVPLLILPIGAWKRPSLTLVLLLGIKLMVLLLLLLFVFTLLLLALLVGIIETSLFNLWGCGGCCCCSCSSRNWAACSSVSSPENMASSLQPGGTRSDNDLANSSYSFLFLFN